MPALAAVPGVLCARRFRGAGGNRTYVALYSLTYPRRWSSRPRWKQARQSDWTSTVCSRTSRTTYTWCSRHYVRGPDMAREITATLAQLLDRAPPSP